MEKNVVAEAMRSTIHIVLPLLRSTCDTLHFLGEKSIFSSLLVALFCRFLPSNEPIMLYNIHYWWFFLSQVNWRTNYLAHPKIRRPKTLLVDVCIFGPFRRLSPAVHSADCRFDLGVKWLIHVLSIVTYLRKNFFLLRWNSCKQRSESLARCCFW